MFGLIRRRRKPVVHAHWFVPLLDFASDTDAFFQAVEEEIASRKLPGVSAERVEFRQDGWLSEKRTYLRFLRERVVVDVCSAPFGTGWYFSCRAAELPRMLSIWELLLFLLGLGGFFLLYWQMFGLIIGSIVMGGTVIFLLLVLLTARSWASLQEFILYLPVIGALHERFTRRDTYQLQDHRLVYAAMLESLLRAKVEEFAKAGGVDEPKFIHVSNPDQVLSRRELERLFGTSDRE